MVYFVTWTWQWTPKVGIGRREREIGKVILVTPRMLTCSSMFETSRILCSMLRHCYCLKAAASQFLKRHLIHPSGTCLAQVLRLLSF